ncbi:MAG: DUF2812 domain-containing protein [Lachnospiraceae bacterium]|nr:DUF2812 domain-containing protein [Lachnospiraceae bacterium]
MAGKYKTSFRAYSAWNYEKEVEDLNRASEEGWQLVKGGCFHSRFVNNPNIRYRYQLDFGRIEDMGRYIEMHREQGWEYINSTFNGWHYLRKIYDPSLPEEEYEIFTDRQSLNEMNHRWANIALGIGIVLAILAVISGIQMIRMPQLPTLVRLLTMAIEAVVLLRGVAIMRNPEASRSSRSDSLLLTLFLVVVILGASSMIWLSYHRPHTTTAQYASSIDEPIVDNRWNDINIAYADNYYLDLKIKSDEPLTFAVVNEADEIVYTVTETDFSEENILLKLPRGHYQFSMSCTSGFEIEIEME